MLRLLLACWLHDKMEVVFNNARNNCDLGGRCMYYEPSMDQTCWYAGITEVSKGRCNIDICPLPKERY